MRLSRLLDQGVKVQGAAWQEVEITALDADSRKVGPGTLFAAFPGSKTDGRAFIADAVTRGAAAVLADPSLAHLKLPVPLILDVNPRRRLALMAARLFEHQPRCVAAVTGTNGKTSVAGFSRQLWTSLGFAAGSLGTLGLDAAGVPRSSNLTTPDPVQLHVLLAEVAAAGIDHLVLEASSHGLDQHRLDGVRFTAAAFTNLSRDHFDYHGSFAEYLAAKRRLFSELLPPEGIAVLNADQPEYAPLAEVCRGRGIAVLDYGRQAERLQLRAQVPDREGQDICFALDGEEHRVRLGLVGRFQAANALAALGLVVACGADAKAAVGGLAGLQGVRGRLERIPGHPEGAQVFVDYAHTPDALAQALDTLRPHAEGRLIALFGCGGDRDPGKRAEMGRIAAVQADRVFVTDDNPRSEDPAAIRRAILAGCPGAREIGDRRAAIRCANAEREAGDVLLVAGKGHENGQIVGDRVLPFDDAAEVRRACGAGRGHSMKQDLWTAPEIAAATGGRTRGNWAVSGVSIDSRTVQPGELFVALRGPNHDGHAFVADALARGAAALVDQVPQDLSEAASLVVVDDTMAAITALGQAARVRSKARIAALTGSVGKTGSKEALRLALSKQAPTHANAASHNNHWGVPLSLARAPRDTAYAVYELGMNAPGEIAALARLVRPHVAMITTVEAAHLGFFPSVEAIADAKGEIFEGLERGGIAVLNADSPHCARLQALAEAAGCVRVIGFGAGASATARLRDAHLDSEGSHVVMTLDGREIAFRIGVPGRHWISNALGVIACAAALGADPEAAAHALAEFSAPAGRGRRHRLAVRGGWITLIDDSYNANPASVGAALEVLGRAPERKLAALGDMLELGNHAPRLHAGLAGPIATCGVDRVYTAGPAMRHLHDALPATRRGPHVDDAMDLLPVLEAELRPGDTLLVKGSLGMRMGRIVEALLAQGEPERRVAGRGR